jgi:hypothetical protein
MCGMYGRMVTIKSSNENPNVTTVKTITPELIFKRSLRVSLIKAYPDNNIIGRQIPAITHAGIKIQFKSVIFYPSLYQRTIYGLLSQIIPPPPQ